MKKFWYVFMLFAACLVSCNNTDDLEDDIDNLNKRVTSLETQIGDLNSNIEAIRMLCEGGKTITNVANADGVYTLTLSDGTTLKLIEKTATTALFPIIGINDKGNWQVSYDNGKTFDEIKVNGKPVQAQGKDGVTPKFRVNKGYWEVCTDGKNYVQVKDENGQPVQAIPSAGAPTQDSFFQNVTNNVANGTLDITLKDGTLLTIPVVKDFFCYFDAKQYAGEQAVPAGSFKEFDLHIKGADAVSVIAAPAGWLVEVGEPTADVAKVKVTAPAAAPKMRAIADNSKDIAILAVKGVHAQMAKIQVVAGEGSAPAPVETDYYADYEAGKDIKIGSLTINKSQKYTVKQLDATKAVVDLSKEIHQLKTPTILFLKGTANNFITKSVREITAKVILIGQNKKEMPVLKPEAFYKLKEGGLAFKNIAIDITTFDGTANNSYFLNNGNATTNTEFLVIEDCSIKGVQKHIFYAQIADKGVKQIEVRNTKIECNAANLKQKVQLFQIYKTTNLDNYSAFTFENNTVYNATTCKGQIWSWDQNVASTGAVNNNTVNLTIKNNIFVNMIGSDIFCKLYKNANLTITKNVFYGDKVNENDTKSSALYCYYGQGAQGTLNVDDNKLYDLSTVRKWTNYNSKTTLKNDKVINGLVSLKTTPFDKFDVKNGEFTLKAEYATYGPQK